MANLPCHQDSEFFNTLGVLASKLLVYDPEELEGECTPSPYLTDEENDQLCKAFTLLDLNGDGVIGVTEIEKMLISWGRLPINDPLAEILECSHSLGIEGTPGMSYEAFKEYIVKQLKDTDNEKELRECFEAFDTTPPTGLVNLVVLRDYMKNEGLRLTDDEIDFLYREEDYWMLDEKPMFEYDQLIKKILDPTTCQSKFLGC